MCVWIFRTIFISNISHCKKNWARYDEHDRQCTYNVTLRRVRATTVAVEKQWVLHNLSVFVPLDIQHAMGMHHVICGLPHSTIFFHIISQTARFKKKKVFEHKTRVSNFSTTFVWNIFRSKKNWARYDQKHICVFMYSSCPISIKFEFFDRFSKNTPISDVMKIRPVGPELFHAVRRTGMTKLVVDFRNFSNVPKKTTCLKIKYVTIHRAQNFANSFET